LDEGVRDAGVPWRCRPRLVLVPDGLGVLVGKKKLAFAWWNNHKGINYNYE
jgi:hypothetical protein